jgi:hypothetical protein
MKAYLMTTGVVFGLITLLHIWRITFEPYLVKEPLFVVLTLAAAGLSAWAWRLVKLSSRSR